MFGHLPSLSTHGSILHHKGPNIHAYGHRSQIIQVMFTSPTKSHPQELGIIWVDKIWGPRYPENHLGKGYMDCRGHVFFYWLRLLTSLEVNQKRRARRQPLRHNSQGMSPMPALTGSQGRTESGSLTLALSNQGNSATMWLAKEEWGQGHWERGGQCAETPKCWMNYMLMSLRLVTKLWTKKAVKHLPKSLLNERELSRWHKRGSGKSWLGCLMKTGNSKVALGAKKKPTKKQKTHSPVFSPRTPGMWENKQLSLERE